MIKASNFVEKYLLFTFIFSGIYFIFPHSILHSECECPPPYENAEQASMEFVTPQIVYASPGQEVSATVVINNDISICCDPGDPWPWCCAMWFTGDYGSGWKSWIYQGASDCRTQHWSIPVPFGNDDTATVCGSYAHPRASGITIYVTPYTDPAPGKTTDMDAVNTYTGAFYITDEDYSNSDLEFKRYYNTMSLVGTYQADTLKRWKNPIGIGWQHSYNVYLEEIQQISGIDTTNGCLIHKGSATSLYIEDSLGRYCPKRGNHSNLMKSGNTWKLYNSDGDIYYFGSSGKADSIVDRNGNKTKFTYSGNYLSQV